MHRSKKGKEREKEKGKEEKKERGRRDSSSTSSRPRDTLSTKESPKEYPGPWAKWKWSKSKGDWYTKREVALDKYEHLFKKDLPPEQTEPPVAADDSDQDFANDNTVPTPVFDNDISYSRTTVQDCGSDVDYTVAAKEQTLYTSSSVEAVADHCPTDTQPIHYSSFDNERDNTSGYTAVPEPSTTGSPMEKGSGDASFEKHSNQGSSTQTGSDNYSYTSTSYNASLAESSAQPGINDYTHITPIEKGLSTLYVSQATTHEQPNNMYLPLTPRGTFAPPTPVPYPRTHPNVPVHVRTKNPKVDWESFDPNYKVHHSSNFKVGRVFKIMFSEPEGDTALDPRGQSTSIRERGGQREHAKIRRFIVIRTKKGRGQSTCIGIYTYSEQGVMKRGVQAEDHAVIYTEDAPYLLREECEKGLWRNPVKMEPSSGRHKLSPMSRINYAKVHTIEHNVKVWFIGSVAKGCMDDLKRNYNHVNDLLPVEGEYAGPAGREGSTQVGNYQANRSMHTIPEAPDPYWQDGSDGRRFSGNTSTFPGTQQWNSDPYGSGQGPSNQFGTYHNTQWNAAGQAQAQYGTVSSSIPSPDQQWENGAQNSGPSNGGNVNYSQYDTTNYGYGNPHGSG